MTTNTRNRGASRLLIGIAGTFLVYLLFIFLDKMGYAPRSSFALIPFCIPAVYALSGLLELVAGVPIEQIAAHWDGLAGWQRGILGILVCVATVAVFAIGVVLFA